MTTRPTPPLRPFLGAALGLISLAAAPLVAQGHHHRGGGTPYFDPGTITTVSGRLAASFDDWPPWGDGNHTGGGMHFELAADSGEDYELMLAPAWFLAEHGLSLAVGDRVTVTGSVVEPYVGFGPMGGHDDGDDFLIATVLTAQGTQIALRDTDGYPLWRGGPDWHGERWFDPNTLTTANGELVRGLGFWSPWGDGNHTGGGMHYLLRDTDGGLYYLMLGPWWFLEDAGLALEEGDRVTVEGSIVDPYWPRYDDHPYLVAMAVTRDGTTVRLRDDDGYPLWHGTGMPYFTPPVDAWRWSELTGTVVRTRTRTRGGHLDPGYEAVCDFGGGRYTVYFAPQWNAEQIGFSLAAGDGVAVRGVVVARGNRREVVVRDVVVDGRRWRFRNAHGDPLWVRGAR